MVLLIFSNVLVRGNNIMDSKLRTFVKTISFKILTTGVTYLITKNLAGAIVIHTAMTLCFIVHERLWSRVKWGMLKQTKLLTSKE